MPPCHVSQSVLSRGRPDASHVRSLSQYPLGLGQYIGFAPETSFRDIPEDIVPVSKHCFLALPECPNISRIAFLNIILYPIFPVPVFLVLFSLPVENYAFCYISCLDSPVFPVSCWQIMFLVSYHFPFCPFPVPNSVPVPISRPFPVPFCSLFPVRSCNETFFERCQH